MEKSLASLVCLPNFCSNGLDLLCKYLQPLRLGPGPIPLSMFNVVILSEQPVSALSTLA